ncbi:hypothetical protein E2562_002431 [Oryza meyeriana var. granulata]|uniref:Uncharacterized protein n=1 Tax=Oryza meyeriana var. granulata TaxID=110450 RepID=A0A6G1F2J4_9ORYZ|nr:hypothetical protein E2562_002431 [Oryza meyeriana var. granulata]
MPLPSPPSRRRQIEVDEGGDLPGGDLSGSDEPLPGSGGREANRGKVVAVVRKPAVAVARQMAAF